MSAPLWLPNYIQAERRNMAEELPDFSDLLDKTMNLPIEFYVKHGVFPRYAYMKTEVYEHESASVVRDQLRKLKIEVRHHKAIPWWVCVMHREPVSAVDVARFYGKRKPIEAIEQGYMVEV